MMSWTNLVLWMNLFPSAVGVGLLVAWAVYFAVRPRARPGWAEVPAEGWRVIAMAAAVPAFFLGAELTLWGARFGWRAPLVFTALPDRLGWTLALIAPLPLVAHWVWERPATRRVQALTAGLALVAGLLIVGPPRARAAAVAEVAARAAGDPAALEELMNLVAFRYVPAETAIPALDAARPSPEDALAYVEAARAGEAPTLTAPLRAHLAGRLVGALEARADGLGPAVVPAVAWLTGEDEATLRAFALTAPELRAAALGRAVDPQAAAVAALTRDVGPARPAVLEATYRLTDGALLQPGLIAALGARIDDPAPIGPLSARMLLRDASSPALRLVVPRFRDPQASEWSLLRTDCPRQTAGLRTLEADPDAAVAQGAEALLGYVRQYCRMAARTQG